MLLAMGKDRRAVEASRTHVVVVALAGIVAACAVGAAYLIPAWSGTELGHRVDRGLGCRGGGDARRPARLDRAPAAALHPVDRRCGCWLGGSCCGTSTGSSASPRAQPGRRRVVGLCRGDHGQPHRQRRPVAVGAGRGRGRDAAGDGLRRGPHRRRAVARRVASRRWRPRRRSARSSIRPSTSPPPWSTLQAIIGGRAARLPALGGGAGDGRHGRRGGRLRTVEPAAAGQSYVAGRTLIDPAVRARPAS